MNHSPGDQIIGGFNTTNSIIFDIEEPANLKYLGLWLEEERINGTDTFNRMVQAIRMRIRIAKTLFSNASFGIYGTPNGPLSFPNENFTLS